MNVLLITHIFPPAIDGGSRVIFKIGEYLKSRNFNVSVLSSNCYSTDDFTHKTSVHTPNGLPVITFLHRPLKFISKFFPWFTPFAKGPIFNPIPFLLNFLKIIRNPPDLIIAGPLPTTVVIYARIIRFFTKSKLLINASFHPTDPDFSSPLLISSLKSADFIWTLTDYETNYFNHQLNIPLSKLINLGNGIDKSYFSEFKIGSYLIYVGSLSAHKGIDTLLNLKQKIYICGKDTLYSQNLKFPQNFTLKKNLTDSQIKKLIQKSSILILPSSQESFGLVLLEAWACHKPVITSDIPQLSEMIAKSGGGLTFKLHDSLDLSNKIEKILKSKKLYSQLADSGFRYASNHTWDKIGLKLCQKLGL